jgi:hypothetical protein
VLGAVSGADRVRGGIVMEGEVRKDAGQPSPEVLAHAADCKCAPCRAFWWELFVVNDERAVMTREVGDGR